MSGGLNEDLRNTKAVVNGSMSRTMNGRTWLRHLDSKQSGMIDLLILEGTYSVREIAAIIEKKFPRVTDSIKRVEGHIDHLQQGEPRGRASGTKPHYLKIITDVSGKIRFAVN